MLTSKSLQQISLTGLLLATPYLCAKDGFFVGGELGFGYVQKSIPKGNTQYTYGIDYGVHYGARAGYLHTFSYDDSLRIYASAALSNLFPVTGAPSSEGYSKKIGFGYKYDLNVDYIYNLIKSQDTQAGIYGGVFAGYSQWDGRYYDANGQEVKSMQEIRKGLGYGLNLGMTIIRDSHIVDFGMKIPLGGPNIKLSNANNREKSWKNGNVGFAYSYLF